MKLCKILSDIINQIPENVLKKSVKQKLLIDISKYKKDRDLINFMDFKSNTEDTGEEIDDWYIYLYPLATKIYDNNNNTLEMKYPATRRQQELVEKLLE